MGAVVEEAEEHEIVASDNLKGIDPAAAQVLAGGKAAEEDTADLKTAAADVKVEKPAVEETTDVKVEVGRSNTEETTGNEEEFNFEESLGWTAVQGRKGRKGKKGLSKLKGIISELKAEEAEKKEVIEEPKVLSPPSSPCGSPRRSTTSPVPPSSTGSASRVLSSTAVCSAFGQKPVLNDKKNPTPQNKHLPCNIVCI